MAAGWGGAPAKECLNERGAVLKTSRGYLLLLAMASGLGCGSSPVPLHPVREAPVSNVCASGCGERMDVTFLGVSGYLIRWGSHSLLTGPLFTRISLRGVIGNTDAVVDTGFIDAKLGAGELHDAMSEVDGILIGHSHYDHLMDVPYIAHTYARQATIYGTPTMGHILAGDSSLGPACSSSGVPPNSSKGPDGCRVVVIDSADVGSGSRNGTWMYVRRAGESATAPARFRVMALRSAHARNFLWYTLAPGMLHADLEALPRRVQGWKLGESYAYLIDLIRPDSSVAFRLYYMDAVGAPPSGFPPPLVHDGGTVVTVALMCAGNFEQVEDYPGDILSRVHPKSVLLGHWENFFSPQSDAPKAIPAMRARELADRMDEAMPDSRGWITPEPFSTFHFCNCR